MACPVARREPHSVGIRVGLRVQSQDGVTLGRVSRLSRESFYVLGGEPVKERWIPIVKVLSGPMSGHDYVIISEKAVEFFRD
jgi:hypothetical protein